MAGALELMAGGKDRSIETEQWWAQSLAAAGPAGDLRMVLNLEKIVPSPYFRSYWVQRNIADMKEYSSSVSDLFRSDKDYREERVLVKKEAPAGGPSENDGAAGVAELARLVPVQAGIYELKANPSPADCFALLETKLLAPHLGPPATEKLAPQVALTNGETGSGSDLETRIDQAAAEQAGLSEGGVPLKDLFQKNRVRALLQVQATERDKEGVFVRFHSAFGLLGESDWNEAALRASLVDFAKPSLTAGGLGLQWHGRPGAQELNGLWDLIIAVRGKYLFVSDHTDLLDAMLVGMNQPVAFKPALFVGGFDHAHERENFARLTGSLDRFGNEAGAAPGMAHTPEFFSENLQSLSSTLAEVASEKIVVRDAGDKVLETVTYEWVR